jgi:hypothetical protein
MSHKLYQMRYLQWTILMPEKLETINQYLRDAYGIDTDDSEPMFRVVWSDDQFEKRETKYTDAGVELLHAEVRELPKYQWAKHFYILERRVLVPDMNLKELGGIMKSYEPLWVFKTNNDVPVPPTIEGCKFVIDCLYAALGKKSMAKYKDPNIGETPEEQYEINKTRIDKIEEELFGNESGLKQQTIGEGGSGIIVPSTYEKEPKIH